jgi:putative heme-binding domain-containing protein
LVPGKQLKRRLRWTFFLVSLLTATAQLARTAEPCRAEFGLDRRVPWTTSRLVGSPDPPPKYIAERVFPSLTFEAPCEMAAIPGTNRLVVVEVNGKLFSFENRPEASDLTPDLFADLKMIDPKFHLVYGITFHPKFPENRYCYISYVLQPKTPDGTRVSRFKVTDTDPPRVDLASEEIVITWVSGGHNGAHLQFGPDGYLYISSGDGGESFPPDGRNTGQDNSDLLANILRIDVDRPEEGRRYRIPPDNPFVNQPNARGEIWAYGLRNPWKMCFDPADGSLWVGDVGWEMWEMIYRVERGGNYGWSIVEARQPVHQERQRGPTPILPPTVEHSHIEARSITGGYFSQSSRLPELHGAYVYGDYVTGKIWAVWHEGSKVTSREELVDTPLQIVSFGLDHAGEVYIVDHPGGGVYRLAANPRQGVNRDFPTKLSETGLFTSTKDHAPAPGVIPYSINAEPWADGTTADRFVALPGESRLGIYKKTDIQIGYIAGEWEFPSGGVLAKTVSLELEPGNPASRRKLETQVLQYDFDTWRAYNYIWSEDQTDALLAPDQASDQTLEIRDPAAPGAKRRQSWHHASRTECILCHTTRAGSIHGFRLPQLEREHNYDGSLADQLRTLDHIGLFAEPLPEKIEAWPNPHDKSADLTARARAYLHVNCGHCHRRGGGGSSFFDVNMTHPLEKTSLLGTRPTQGTFGIHGAQIVAPGDPFRAVLYYRISKLGHGRMPQFGSQVVDPRGTQLMHDWIAGLPLKSEDPARAAVQRLRAEERDAIEELAGEKDVGDAAASALGRLLASPSGGLQLLVALDDNRLAEPVKQLAISRGAGHSDPTIRDLFERFLPEEQRTRRLGATIRPEAILALAGDAQRGRQLFLESAGVQCKNCHKIGDAGKQLGPELTTIGKKLDRAKLLESILQPSLAIEPQYAAWFVETTDGLVHTGLLVRRTDTEVQLKTAGGEEIAIAAAEIERLAPQQKSLMPDLLVQEMTAQQVADLLEYLSQLR